MDISLIFIEIYFKMWYIILCLYGNIMYGLWIVVNKVSCVYKRLEWVECDLGLGCV